MKQHRALLTLSLAALLALACGTEEPTTDEAPDSTEAAVDGATDAGAGVGAEEPAEEDPHDDEGADGTDDAGGSDDDAADADGPSGELGTVTVDGSSYAVERVIVCDPDEDAGFDRDLELQAIGDADGSRIQLDVVLGGILPVDVSWAGPEGIFGMGEMGTADASQDGDRLSGTASLEDAFGEGATVDLRFDVVVPGDTTSCR